MSIINIVILYHYRSILTLEEEMVLIEKSN